MNITKKSLSTIAVTAVGVLVPTAAAMAPTASATTEASPLISAGVTLPTQANPTAQFKTTGIASKKVTTTKIVTTIQDRVTANMVPALDTETYTEITYTNGDRQTITDSTTKANNGVATQHDVVNTTSMPNGGYVEAGFENHTNVGESPWTSFDSSTAYAAKTKTYTNVRDTPSTKGGVLTVLAPNTSMVINPDPDYSDTAPGWSMASNTQIDNALAKRNAKPYEHGYIADSTLTITPLS